MFSGDALLPNPQRLGTEMIFDVRKGWSERIPTNHWKTKTKRKELKRNWVRND
jgi:hypothetical protein